ncbi:hypothetical protein KQX54_012662 [Cotesia glomerata]|uniref:Dynein heavy chain hydrolytic ATP-binding dynein motor region domain-containing protein n=1 Tax=Cotesia glomerata TaxID=32391 RepID=A0AAV7HYC9_COTGL|nr:hypothetical protein KQX54_012662 [Cotesia glomerata]
MHLGYAGQSNLPNNLNKLFGSLAMTTSEKQQIAQIMFFSQGFRFAEKLASNIVPDFKFWDEIQKIKEGMVQKTSEESADKISIAKNLPEQEIFMQSVCKTMFPELVRTRLKKYILKVCAEEYLVYEEGYDKQGAIAKKW